MTRVLDIFLSFLGLLILSPVLLVIALWIWVGSKGPVIYKQKRVGKNGREFLMFKFRTMYTDAEKQGFLTVGTTDKRITPQGLFLRKYKLDELPQLFNVLTGEMSVVGPRPEVKKYVDLYTPEERSVLNVLPGITDIASVVYRNENEILAGQADPEKYYIEYIMPEKIKLNRQFINEPTVINYLKVIYHTFRKIFIKNNSSYTF